MKQMVLKLDIHDIKIKQRAMKAVSGISGVEAVSVDLKDNKMTVKGDVDPVQVVSKLRKFCHTELVTVGPEPEKKKEEPKKEEPKKPAASVVEKKPDNTQYYYVGPPPPMYASYTIAHEEYPQGCVIC